MGAAISIFVLLSLSVFVVRLASVALRITGLSDGSARFQALSAFTGTGFTTTEAESIVNYPVRRRIVGILMIIGNLGLVTILAALVTSLVHADGEVTAVVEQMAWLLGGMGLLWFLMLNRTADRIICGLIGRFLESATVLGRRGFHRLLQIGDGYSVCEHSGAKVPLNDQGALAEDELAAFELTVLAIRSPDGETTLRAGVAGRQIDSADTLVLFGADRGHEALARRKANAAVDDGRPDGPVPGTGS